MMIENYHMSRCATLFFTSVLLCACSSNTYFHSRYQADIEFNPKKHCFNQLNTLQEHSIKFHDEHGHNISASSVDLNNFHQETHCTMMPTAREPSIEYPEATLPHL